MDNYIANVNVTKKKKTHSVDIPGRPIIVDIADRHILLWI